MKADGTIPQFPPAPILVESSPLPTSTGSVSLSSHNLDAPKVFRSWFSPWPTITFRISPPHFCFFLFRFFLFFLGGGAPHSRFFFFFVCVCVIVCLFSAPQPLPAARNPQGCGWRALSRRRMLSLRGLHEPLPLQLLALLAFPEVRQCFGLAQDGRGCGRARPNPNPPPPQKKKKKTQKKNKTGSHRSGPGFSGGILGGRTLVCVCGSVSCPHNLAVPTWQRHVVLWVHCVHGALKRMGFLF